MMLGKLWSVRMGAQGALILALALSFGGFAAAADSVSLGEVKGPLPIGGASRVSQLRHLYLADQPDTVTLQQFKSVGGSLVINLRDPSEMDWDEKSAVEALGMTYENVPVDGKNFTSEAFTRIESLVKGAGGEKVFIHCSSANRVGGWLATHLVEAHGSTLDDALAIGRKVGITKPAVEQSVRAYVAKTQGKQR